MNQKKEIRSIQNLLADSLNEPDIDWIAVERNYDNLPNIDQNVYIKLKQEQEGILRAKLIETESCPVRENSCLMWKLSDYPRANNLIELSKVGQYAECFTV